MKPPVFDRRKFFSPYCLIPFAFRRRSLDVKKCNLTMQTTFKRRKFSVWKLNNLDDSRPQIETGGFQTCYLFRTLFHPTNSRDAASARKAGQGCRTPSLFDLPRQNGIASVGRLFLANEILSVIVQSQRKRRFQNETVPYALNLAQRVAPWPGRSQ